MPLALRTATSKMLVFLLMLPETISKTGSMFPRMYVLIPSL